MAPHSSTLAWRVPWTEEPGGLQSMGSRRVGTTEWLHFHFSLSCIGEGNGNPLQCSCLENPRDGGAWWAASLGSQSQTRLKRLCGSSSSDLMAPHSSTLAWTIPWMEEPGRLQSMGSRKVRYDFPFTFHFHALEKAMATHSNVLAWRIPLTRGAW